MIKKKSRFWTFVFSMLPGAGHMYMGFFRQGISFMGAFFGLIAVTALFDLGPLMFIMPVIWFYAFFDALNKSSLSDEEFYQLQDDYIFPFKNLPKPVTDFFQKRAHLIGGILIFLGVYLIYVNLFSYISSYFPLGLQLMLNNVNHSFPQVILGIAVIFFGVKLINGKKGEGSDE